MKTYELVVPCHFGLEAVLKREIYDLGYEISHVEDGKVTFFGEYKTIPPLFVVIFRRRLSARPVLPPSENDVPRPLRSKDLPWTLPKKCLPLIAIAGGFPPATLSVPTCTFSDFP